MTRACRDVRFPPDGQPQAETIRQVGLTPHDLERIALAEAQLHEWIERYRDLLSKTFAETYADGLLSEIRDPDSWLRDVYFHHKETELKAERKHAATDKRKADRHAVRVRKEAHDQPGIQATVKGRFVVISKDPEGE